MWLAGFQIPLRYKLYLLAAAAFVLGLLRWRNAAVSNAIDELKARQREAEDQARRTSAEVRDEVEILDDVGLYERASRWVRNHND
jgi:hypothetical protein